MGVVTALLGDPTVVVMVTPAVVAMPVVGELVELAVGVVVFVEVASVVALPFVVVSVVVIAAAVGLTVVAAVETGADASVLFMAFSPSPSPPSPAAGLVVSKALVATEDVRKKGDDKKCVRV